MTVKEIVEKWLRDNGYDGLVSPHDPECGCELHELILCNDGRACNAAYRGPDPSGHYDWLMYESKEAAEAATDPVVREALHAAMVAYPEE